MANGLNWLTEIHTIECINNTQKVTDYSHSPFLSLFPLNSFFSLICIRLLLCSLLSLVLIHPSLLCLCLYHFLLQSFYLSVLPLALIPRALLCLFLLSSAAFFFISVCLPHFISTACWFIAGTKVCICVFVHMGKSIIWKNKRESRRKIMCIRRQNRMSKVGRSIKDNYQTVKIKVKNTQFYYWQIQNYSSHFFELGKYS